MLLPLSSPFIRERFDLLATTKRTVALFTWQTDNIRTALDTDVLPCTEAYYKVWGTVY
jgi:hypothetical protein